jgi:hypothetical protein
MRAAKSLVPTLPLIALLSVGCGSSKTSSVDAAPSDGAGTGGTGGVTRTDALPRDTRPPVDYPPGSGGSGPEDGSSTGGSGAVDAPMGGGGTSGGAPGSDSGAGGSTGGGSGQTGGVSGGSDGPGTATGGTAADGPTASPDSQMAGTFPGAGTCDSPFVLPDTLDPRMDLAVNTTGAAHAFNLPCATNAGDVVFTFILTQREIVYADTFGASWNTVLYFSNSCGITTPPSDPGTALCSDDACGTSQSQAVAVMGYGRHYLVVSGAQGASGSATVHFEHMQVGNSLTQLPAGSGMVAGNTTGTGIVSQCEAAGPENSYWWKSCPDYAGGAFTATTCHLSTFDTILSVQIPRAGGTSCADDDPACGVQSTVGATVPPGAGLHALTIDGSTPTNAGNYSIMYTRP